MLMFYQSYYVISGFMLIVITLESSFLKFVFCLDWC